MFSCVYTSKPQPRNPPDANLWRIKRFRFANVGIVTPTFARQALDLNFEDNRSLSPSRVARYSSEMKRGAWLITEPIKISSCGKLIDGQHRLAAVIESGQNVPFLVVTGYPFNTSSVLDQGKTRTAKNIAEIKGLRHLSNNHLSSMRLLALSHTNWSFTINLVPKDLVFLAEKHKDCLEFGMRHSSKKYAIKYTPLLSMVAAAYHHENHQRLDELLEVWHTGLPKNTNADSSIINLRNYYNKDRKFSGAIGYRIDFTQRAQTAIRAFLNKQPSSFSRPSEKLFWEVPELKADLKKLIF